MPADYRGVKVNRKTIRSGEYRGRGMKILELGGKVRRIRDGAFSGCSGLGEVIIPEGVKSAGRFVFQDCPEIKHIRIPSTLTDLSENAFFVGSEGALEEFFADQGNPAYRSEDGVLFTKDMKTLTNTLRGKPETRISSRIRWNASRRTRSHTAGTWRA